MAKFIKKRFPTLFVATYFIVALSMVGFLVFPALFTSASGASDFINHGVSAATWGPSYTDRLVLDVTIPDAWNGASYIADILQKNGSGEYWQGDTLNDIPALGTTSGVGYKEDSTEGFQGAAAEAVIRDLDADSVYTSAADFLVDGDGSSSSGAGSVDPAAATGDPLTAMGNDIGHGAVAVCTDNLVSPTAVRIDLDGDCTNNSSNDGTYVLGTNVIVAAVEVTSAWAFGDPSTMGGNDDGDYDNGEDIFIENFAGELTYSASADTQVYSGDTTPSAGDPLTDFPADCNGTGAGTQACKYTGTAPIDSTEDIYIDEGTAGGAAPNSVVDRRDDQLIGIGVQNSGTAVDTTDIATVEVWADGSIAGWSGDETNLGAMTVHSTDNKEWRLGGLTQAVPAGGKRIFVTVDISATPTNGRTLIFRIPVYNDVGGDGVVSQNNDRGVFMASGNDGPTDAEITNPNVQIIDSQPPTPTPTNITTTKTEAYGHPAVANPTDIITVVWNASATGDNWPDVASVSANFVDFGGGTVAMEDDGSGGTCNDTAAGDKIWCARYIVAAGSIDDTDNDVTITLATDNVGNVAADVTDDLQFSVDNQAPTVSASCISVTGATGTGGAFKFGDTPVPTWNNTAGCDNNADISAVTFNASQFRTGDMALGGVNTANVWTASLNGAMDSQDDTNNNVSATVTDDALNQTTTNGTNNYTIDTQVPAFAGTNPVRALLQSGGATTLPTKSWYYYDSKFLRIQVTNAAESDGNPLAGVKACLRSMKTDDQAEICDTTEFGVSANYTALTVANTTTSTSNYTLNVPNLGALPTQKGGYPVNIQLIDDAGNTALSTSDPQVFAAIWNIDPKLEDPSINNSDTTDWATIDDFTAVSGLVFNAQDSGTNIARFTFTGPLNLTDLSTITGLQNFAANVTTSPAVMKVRSDNLPALDAPAQLMVKMATANQPGFTVKDNDGAVLGYIPNNAGAGSSYDFGGFGTASNFVWNGGAQTLTFNVTGFSSYESDNTAPTVSSFSPANGATGVATTANVVVTFSEPMNTGSFTYTLSPDPGGLSVAWSGGDTVATISHTPFLNNTLYTFTVTAAKDKVGNDVTGTLATAFRTVAAGGGGGGGGTAPTAISLTAPNGGESLAGNSTQNITWISSGLAIDKVKLLYSTDRGTTFPNVIATGEANDGTYTWTVPNISSSTVKVKIEAYDSVGNLLVSDISDADFTITYTPPVISADNSTVSALPTSVLADGVATSTITVTVKDGTGAALSGKTVTLSSSRGAQDTITTVTGTTGTDGVATFRVKSSTAGTSTYTATANGVVITQTASVVFTTPEQPEVPPAEMPVGLRVGDLIKSELSTAVYYFGPDNKRHLFPNEVTYKTWYLDWTGIKTIPASQLQGIALGKNVTVRPGTVLVKIQTDPKVYAVEPRGSLRWVPTEARARTLYGPEWAKRIVDVPLVFWGDYTFGTDITTDTHPTGALIKYEGMADVYYIQGLQKRRIVSDAAFVANNFRRINILTVPATMYYASGTDIVGLEPDLTLLGEMR